MITITNPPNGVHFEQNDVEPIKNFLRISNVSLRSGAGDFINYNFNLLYAGSVWPDKSVYAAKRRAIIAWPENKLYLIPILNEILKEEK